MNGDLAKNNGLSHMSLPLFSFSQSSPTSTATLSSGHVASSSARIPSVMSLSSLMSYGAAGPLSTSGPYPSSALVASPSMNPLDAVGSASDQRTPGLMTLSS